ncbi:MAG: AMP-binding protein [Hymenobacter sp.]
MKRLGIPLRPPAARRGGRRRRRERRQRLTAAEQALGQRIGLKMLVGGPGAQRAGWVNFGAHRRPSPREAAAAATRADDPLFLFFTSGTTGLPKVVAHTHFSYPVGHLEHGRLDWAAARRPCTATSRKPAGPSLRWSSFSRRSAWGLHWWRTRAAGKLRGRAAAGGAEARAGRHARFARRPRCCGCSFWKTWPHYPLQPARVRERRRTA